MRRTHWNTTRQVSIGDDIRAELRRLHESTETGAGDPFARVESIADLIGTRAAEMVVAQSFKLTEEGAGPICDAQIDMLVGAASGPTNQFRPEL